MRREIQAIALGVTIVLFTSVLEAQNQALTNSQSARSAGTESGFALFQTRCMMCHGNPDVERAPSPAAIREMPPEKIYEALTTGAMKGQGASLNDDQRRMLATFMSGRTLGSEAQGDAKNMPNHCASNPPMTDPSAGPAWNGWGVDLGNTRFQTAKAAGLTAAQVPRLKLKWAFGYPTGLPLGSRALSPAGFLWEPISATSTRWMRRAAASTGHIRQKVR